MDKKSGTRASLLALLRAVLVKRLGARAMGACFRQVGRQLAREHAPRAIGKAAPERRKIALSVLNSLGGEASLIRRSGNEIIQGTSCPLAAITAPYPQTRAIAQTLLSQIIGQPVKEFCVHGARPRYRFQISG